MRPQYRSWLLLLALLGVMSLLSGAAWASAPSTQALWVFSDGGAQRR